MPYKDPAKRRAHHAACVARYREKNRVRLNAEAAARYWENPEAKLAADRERYKADKPRQVQRSMDYIKAHPEKRQASEQRYRAAHSVERVAAASARHALKLNAMPRWADKTEILKFYKRARAITKQTGVPHHVDHRWPLRGDGFVGLHVPWNLQILTAADNLKKGNRLPCGA